MTGSTPQIRVIMAEDHQIVAEGLLSLLDSYPDIDVIGWFPTVAEVVEEAARHRPEVAVLDFRLADGTGAQAAAGIHEVSPDTSAVFLSADASEDALIAAVEAGASGYLIKSANAEDLADAVRRAAEGEMLIPTDQLAGLLVRRRERVTEQRQREALMHRLTSRELDVLALMAEGLDNRALATRLTISYDTARTHVRNILQKLDARSKLEAVVKASEAALLDRGPAGHGESGGTPGPTGTQTDRGTT